MGQGPGPGRPGQMGPAARQPADRPARPAAERTDYGDDVTVKVPGEIDVQARPPYSGRASQAASARASGRNSSLDYIERLLNGGL